MEDGAFYCQVMYLQKSNFCICHDRSKKCKASSKICRHKRSMTSPSITGCRPMDGCRSPKGRQSKVICHHSQLTAVLCGSKKKLNRSVACFVCFYKHKITHPKDASIHPSCRGQRVKLKSDIQSLGAFTHWISYELQQVTNGLHRACPWWRPLVMPHFAEMSHLVFFCIQLERMYNNVLTHEALCSTTHV